MAMPTSPLAWYKASEITGLSDGDAVATWPDESGNGYDLTQGTAGNRPTYKTSVFGTGPSVRFDGVDNWLASSTVTFNTASAITVAIRFKPLSVGTSGQLIAETGTDYSAIQGWRLTRYVSTPVQFASAASGSSFTTYETTAVSNNSTVNIVGWIDRALTSANEIRAYRNNVDAGLGPYGGANLSGNFSNAVVHIGGKASMGSLSYLHADVAEIIIYARALNSTELADLEDYLNTYGSGGGGGGAGGGEPPPSGSGTTGQEWSVSLSSMTGGLWTRVYAPDDPAGIDNLEAVVDNEGGGVKARFDGVYGLAPEYPCKATLEVDGTNVFTGVIVQTPARYPGRGPYQLESMRWALARSIIAETKTWSSTNAGTIAKYILDNYAPAYIDVPASMTAASVTEFSVSFESIESALDRLARLAGAVWGVDADGEAFFKAATSGTAELDVDDGSTVRTFGAGDFGDVISRVIVRVAGPEYTYTAADVSASPDYGLTTVVEGTGSGAGILVEQETYTVTGGSAFNTEASDGDDLTYIALNSGTDLARQTRSCTNAVGAYVIFEPRGDFTALGSFVRWRVRQGGTGGTVVHTWQTDVTATTNNEPGESGKQTLEFYFDAPYTGNVDNHLDWTLAGSVSGETMRVYELGFYVLNPAYTATSYAESYLRPAAATDVTQVTVQGFVSPSKNAHVIAGAEPTDITAPVVEWIYRVSTQGGIQTIAALGAPIVTPLGARQIRRLIEGINANPYKER